MRIKAHLSIYYIFLLLCLVGAILFLIGNLLWHQMNKPNWSQASVSNRCSIESDRFEKSWGLSNIYMTHQRKGNISLIEKKGYAYFLGSTSLNNYESLVKIDMGNGAIIWKSIQNKSFLNPRPSTMASNDSLVYVGFSSKGKVSGENMLGASEIVAFRILDGDSLPDTFENGSEAT